MASNLLTPAQIAEIREREAKATGGKWWWSLAGSHRSLVATRISPHRTVIGSVEYISEEDATFLVHARSDIPALLAALDAANAENERLRLLLANARSWMRLPASEQHASTIRDFNDTKEAISTALEKTP